MASLIGSLLRVGNAYNTINNVINGGGYSQIGDFIIDCCKIEDLEFSADVPKHPTYNREYVTDHIYLNAEKLTITGIVTDSPMKLFGLIDTPLKNVSVNSVLNNARSFIPTNTTTRPSMQAYLRLKEMFKSRGLFKVVVYYDVLEDMVMTNLKIPKNPETGGKLEFVCELEKARFADTTVGAYKTINNIEKYTASKYAMGVAPKQKIALNVNPKQFLGSVFS